MLEKVFKHKEFVPKVHAFNWGAKAKGSDGLTVEDELVWETQRTVGGL